MDNPEKQKVGAPSKSVVKKKISITVDTPLLITSQETALKSGESFSARVERALKLLKEKEDKKGRRGGGDREDRGFNPNGR